MSARKSVLPPDLEAKCLTIATIHKRMVGVIAISVFAGLGLLSVRWGGNPYPQIVVGIVVLVIVEVFAVRQLFRYDETLCRRFGFLCPHCQKPLYEPRSFIGLNGRCPKCRRSVIPGVSVETAES